MMSWQDLLQLAGVIAPTAGVVAGGIWWCVKRQFIALWARINNLQKQVKTLTEEKESLKQQYRKANNARAESERSLEKVYDLLKKSQTKRQSTVLKYDELRQQFEKLRSNTLGPDVKALLENQVAELQKHLQEARSENETTAVRLREMESLTAKRDAQLTQLRKEKRQVELAVQDRAGAEEKFREAVEEQEEKIDALNAQLEEQAEQHRQLKAELGRKKLRLSETNEELSSLKTQIAELQGQIEGTVEQKGRVWERPLPAGAAAFQPLSERKMPIVSILNLKGGVGKTTITANLAAMLGMQGARVLLLDLDYQRSLTLLCCSAHQISQLHEGRRSLQHFLLDPAADANRLLACATPVKAADGCEIVGNSDPLDGNIKGDNLEDAEMHLLAQWLTNPESPDIRLILRKALHSPWIRERFDYVLLDCPPRLSTACMNALAASDFALIPVMLDYTSANSAHNLLRKLHRLREREVLADLDILGVLANRVALFRGSPVNAQAVVWDELRAPCQVAWGDAVYFFKTVIKQSAGVAEAAARHAQAKGTRTLAAHGDDLKPTFHDLAHEVKTRIAHECQRLATIPAQPATPVGGERGVAANARGS